MPKTHWSFQVQEYMWLYYSIPLRHALLARLSISLVLTTPFTLSSPIASTTASATKSAFNGFSTAAPANQVNRPPTIEFTMLPALPKKAIGNVKVRDESYRKPGRIKMLRSLGNEDAMVDSASLLVVMYLLGRIGVPAAAEMKTNDEVFWAVAS